MLCRWCSAPLTFKPAGQSVYNLRRHLVKRCRKFDGELLGKDPGQQEELARVPGRSGASMYDGEQMGVLKAFLLLVIQDKMPLASGQRPGVRTCFSTLAEG